MTDGSEKCKRQLAFEPQDLRVYEKRSKNLEFFSMLTQRWLRLENDDYLKHFLIIAPGSKGTIS